MKLLCPRNKKMKLYNANNLYVRGRTFIELFMLMLYFLWCPQVGPVYITCGNLRNLWNHNFRNTCELCHPTWVAEHRLTPGPANQRALASSGHSGRSPTIARFPHLESFLFSQLSILAYGNLCISLCTYNSLVTFCYRL